MSRFSILLALCVIGLLSALTAADVPADLIDMLPGYGKPPSKHYSGYLPADAAETVLLHYWFVTSTGNPATDPVAVWMNGGPGASSLEGFLTELGPFYLNGSMTPDGVPTLVDNPYAWTTVSSIIFLEQPAGVGFSYAKNGSVASDDYIQSQNTYGFLLAFFKAYPEYAKNDFFLTGESYAGIYVPTLANRIVDGNAAGQPYINLKGIAVGDGCTGSRVGTCGEGPDVEAANTYIAVEQLHGHAMISGAAYDNVSALCGDWKSPSDTCLTTARAAVRSVGRYDVYDIYHQCYDSAPRSGRRSTAATGSGRPLLRAPNKLMEDVQPLGDAFPCWMDTGAMDTSRSRTPRGGDAVPPCLLLSPLSDLPCFVLPLSLPSACCAAAVTSTTPPSRRPSTRSRRRARGAGASVIRRTCPRCCPPTPSSSPT